MSYLNVLHILSRLLYYKLFQEVQGDAILSILWTSVEDHLPSTRKPELC